MISVIIPTLNEEKNIGRLISFMNIPHSNLIYEIIVVDGGSSDNTLKVAHNAGAIVLQSPQKGRAAQMNFGAAFAKSDILYFVHADVMPPESFPRDIKNALKNKFNCGRFCTQFDRKSYLLKLISFFSRFDWFACYGGDQTFFITRKLFDVIGGFKNEMLIMEDYDISQRAKESGHYAIIPKKITVSARKYDKNSWWRVQIVHAKILRMYKKGACQEDLMREYKKLW